MGQLVGVWGGSIMPMSDRRAGLPPPTHHWRHHAVWWRGLLSALSTASQARDDSCGGGKMGKGEGQGEGERRQG